MGKGLASGDDIINFTENNIDDSVTSGIKAWSSSKINSELSLKATVSSVNTLSDNVDNIESVLAEKADSSALGEQVTFSYNSSTLTLTITRKG